MARTPNPQSNINRPGSLRTLITKKASTHSEKINLLNIQYHIGEIIEYTDSNNQPQWAFKSSEREYIDLRTRTPLDLRQATQFLIKGNVAKWNAIKDRLPEISKNMNKYREHRLTIDFESAVTGADKIVKPSQVYNMGVTGFFGEGEARKLLHRDYYFANIFDEILSSTGNMTGRAAISDMSSQLRAGYFTQMQRLAASAKDPISMVGINSMEDLVGQRETMTALMRELKEVRAGVFEYDNATATSRTVNKLFPQYMGKKSVGKAGLIYINSQNQMGNMLNERGFKSGSAGPITYGAASPALVDIPAMEAVGFGRSGQDFNMIDLRGHQLFTNAALFPSLTKNLHVTMGPMMDRISKRLRLSDKGRQTFFEGLHGGIASMYAPGTAAEDFEATLRYVEGSSDKMDMRATRHMGLVDAFREQKASIDGDASQSKSIKELLSPVGVAGKSPRARRLAALMYHNAVNAKMKDHPMYGEKNAWAKRSAYREADRLIDINMLSREIQEAAETSASSRIERDMLRNNLRTMGGSTIAHLLAGAALISGVRHAARKVKERLTETKANRNEGLSHESIPTILRRMSLTDFASPRLGFNPVSMGGKVLKTLFRMGVTDPKGTPAIIRSSLHKINKYVKFNKAGGSFFNMLSDPNKAIPFATRVFGKGGILSDTAYKLKVAGHIGEKGISRIDNALDKIGSIIAGTSRNKDLKRMTASKLTNRELVQNLANKFVSRGVDNNGQAFMKPTALALSLGVGALGALGIMMSRGSYDPEEMIQPMPTRDDLKYKRAENDRRKIRGTIQDIRNSAMEGLPLGSADRQKQRYTFTDFGSGKYIPIQKIASGIGRYFRRVGATAQQAQRTVKRQVSQMAGGVSPARTRIKPELTGEGRRAAKWKEFTDRLFPNKTWKTTTGRLPKSSGSTIGRSPVETLTDTPSRMKPRVKPEIDIPQTRFRDTPKVVPVRKSRYIDSPTPSVPAKQVPPYDPPLARTVGRTDRFDIPQYPDIPKTSDSRMIPVTRRVRLPHAAKQVRNSVMNENALPKTGKSNIPKHLEGQRLVEQNRRMGISTQKLDDLHGGKMQGTPVRANLSESHPKPTIDRSVYNQKMIQNDNLRDTSRDIPKNIRPTYLSDPQEIVGDGINRLPPLRRDMAVASQNTITSNIRPISVESPTIKSRREFGSVDRFTRTLEAGILSNNVVNTSGRGFQAGGIRQGVGYGSASLPFYQNPGVTLFGPGAGGAIGTTIP